MSLENLAKIGELKVEPPDQREIDGLINSAKLRLKDSQESRLSTDGRFELAYGAAHALARAAMRWRGYRSEKRYIVFQILGMTAGLANAKWRVLSKCHEKRNLAEYEGGLDITPELLRELIAITGELLSLVEGLGPVES